MIILIKRLFFLSFLILTITSSSSYSRQFIDKDHLVIDLLSGVEWLKCAAGQQWNGVSCSGEIIRLNREQIKIAIQQANEQLGGSWRLPTKQELEGILCNACDYVKIDSNFFPETPPEPFWTSEENYWSGKRYWSVNFYTGHSFSRFTKDKPLATRFVRNR